MKPLSSKLHNSKGFGLIEVLLVLAVSAALIISSYRALRQQSDPEIQAAKFQAYFATIQQAANEYFSMNCVAMINATSSTYSDVQLFQLLNQPMKINNPINGATTQITYSRQFPPVTANGSGITYIVIKIQVFFPNSQTWSLLPLLITQTNATQQIAGTYPVLVWEFAANTNPMNIGTLGLDPVTQAKLTYEKVMLRPFIQGGDNNLRICNTFPQTL